MASQTCDQCGAIVAKDEQFCPSCGSFIDPMATPSDPRPRPTAGKNVISVKSDGNYEEFSLDQPPPTDPAPSTLTGAEITCPSCSAQNPPNNRHCQECGARLQQGPLPTAPRPAVQATAGVRAALAISGLLFIVVISALLYNAFTGDGSATETTTTTTSTTLPPPIETGPIDVLQQNCSPDGISSFICANLTNGTGTEYQVNWEDLNDEGVTIEFVFDVPMAITEIRWTNIADETRFLQNYRAKSLTINADDSVSSFPVQLVDQRGTQAFQYSSLNTLRVRIHVVDVYLSEVIDENRFDDMAIDEIEIIGRPATTTGTAPATTTPETTTGG